MSTIFVAAEDRALPLRRRPDVAARPQQLRGKRVWALKDPAALRYFHLSEEERFLYEQLDGRTSLSEIQRRFETVFAPQRLQLTQLHAFIATLHREGLLLGDAPRQGEVLRQRHNERNQRELAARLLGVLAIRFRGVNPQAFLDWLYPRVRWMFSPVALLVACGLVLAAALLVAVQWREVAARLPTFMQFLSGSNLLWLMGTLAVVKILHELAHGLTLRHFGGTCHEIGPMLLLFTPCLYCNTTDAWMLPSKWQRAAVAAAGIGVELLLAALATFLWWWSEPGLFHALCFNVMLVCSVSTLLFNGNPLLKYDGYYVLSDLLEIPNLAQQASAVARGALAKWFLGITLPEDRLYDVPVRRGWLAAYWVASWCYRLLVMALILWGLHRLLAPAKLDALTAFVAAIVLIGLAAAPVSAATRMLRDPTTGERIGKRPAALRTALTIAVLLVVGLIPLPARVSAPSVLQAIDSASLYVTMPGKVASRLEYGTTVRSGQTIAKLTNPEVDLSLERAQAQRNRQQLHLQNLQRQAIRSNEAAEAIPAARAALADYEQRLAELQADAARLTITSPRDGVLLPPPTRHADKDTRQLPQWTGLPLAAHNDGAYLDTGTLLGLVANAQQVEALLLIDQQDVALVRPDQTVSLAVDLYPGQWLRGKLVELSPARVDELPRELVALADVPQRTDAQGRPLPLNKIYQARVRLDEPAPPLLPGAIARARIHVTPQSLVARLSRWLSATFRVQW